MVSTPPPITYSNLILTESPHLTSVSSIGISISGFSIGVGPQIMFSFNLVKLVSLIPLIFNLSSSILKFSLKLNFSYFSSFKVFSKPILSRLSLSYTHTSLHLRSFQSQFYQDFPYHIRLTPFLQRSHNQFHS